MFRAAIFRNFKTFEIAFQESSDRLKQVALLPKQQNEYRRQDD